MRWSSAGLYRAGLLVFCVVLLLPPAPAHSQRAPATLVVVLTDTAGIPLAEGAVWVGMAISALLIWLRW